MSRTGWEEVDLVWFVLLDQLDRFLVDMPLPGGGRVAVVAAPACLRWRGDVEVWLPGGRGLAGGAGRVTQEITVEGGIGEGVSRPYSEDGATWVSWGEGGEGKPL